MKNKLLHILLLTFLYSHVNSQVVFEKKEHDFGILSNWSESPALFEFVNHYDEPIAILTIKKAIEVKVKFPTSYINPGQLDTFFVYYEPLELGKFDEKIEIFTSASDKPLELRIKGRVNSYLECPSAVQANDPSQLIYIHQGVVVDKVTQEPLEKVNITFVNPKNGKSHLKTDGKGRFKKRFEIGLYAVQIEVEGYKFFDKDFYLNRNTPFLVFELEPKKYASKNSAEEKKDSKDQKKNLVEESGKEIAEKTSSSKQGEQEAEKNPVKPVQLLSVYQEGIIVDKQTNTPIGKANVRLVNLTTNDVYTYKTFSDGKFGKQLKPGVYELTVDANDYKPVIREIEITGHASTMMIALEPVEKDTEVEEPSQQLNFNQEGVVLDVDNGNPVNRASVVLKNLETGIIYSYKTFPDGKFKKNIKPGNYELVVDAPGYKTKKQEMLLTSSSENIEVKLEPENLEVPKVSDVFDQKASVLDSFTKTPVNKAFISFYNKDMKTTYSYKTFSDGKFSKRIRPGNYIVRVKAEGYRPLEKEMMIQAPIEDLSFYLSPLKRRSDFVLGEKKEELIKTEKKTEFENRLEEIRTKYQNADSVKSEEVVLSKTKDHQDASDLEVSRNDPEPSELLPRNLYVANNIVFLVDVSASMDKSHKMENLKYSMRHLTDILRDIDNISIMTYSTQPRLVLASVAADQKDTIRKTIDSMDASGFTYGLRGLKQAFEIAETNFIEGGNNEVIIATDGEFNSPDYSELQLIAMINKYARKDIVLSVIGFGNNEKAIRTMKRMAGFGKGNFLHIITREKAESILIEEIKLNSKKEYTE